MTTALPIQSRPFNLEYAKAGAPYALRNSDEATILKWDRRDEDYPLIGIYGSGDETESWQANGQSQFEPNKPRDLVMIPLGYIEGEPVFWDSEIQHGDGTLVAGHVGAFHGLENYRWPAPAKVYPQSTMKMSDVSAACKGHQVAVQNRADFESGKTTMEIEAWGNEGMNNALRWIANAALRHAIDAGQVFMKEDVDAVLAATVDSVKAELAGRAARDMAVAKAVLDAAAVKMHSYAAKGVLLKARFAAEQVASVDLAAIIAKVPK